MELLSIKHKDFILYIECPKFENIWTKAQRNIEQEHLKSTYSWSDGVESVILYTLDGSEELIESEVSSPAIFFENADYPVWVEFDKDVEQAKFASILQSDNDHFSFHKRQHILSGFINFGNDIGKSEINLWYQRNGEQKKFIFRFDVLSTKLNYNEHWRSIIRDIESEYSMLSLDYMRRTYHGFMPDTEGERPDLVWWSIFKEQQQIFLHAIQKIIARPHIRLRRQPNHMQADQLRQISNGIENKVAEYIADESHQYLVEQYKYNNNTQENRFLKYALNQIASRYESIKNRIQNYKTVSETFQYEMDATLREIKKLQRHPFFRTIGKFKGLNQESLVLQRATGYTQIYRTWNILRRAYSLNDGIYRLQSKDIATLYEIWCFIQISHIVKNILAISKNDIEHHNRTELNGMFTWEISKGEHSRILFKKDGIELAELIYNPQYINQKNNIGGISNLVAPTVIQKPDIVLRLVKHDIQQDMKMTYLFDAKYRIDNNSNGVDYPPEDAINQMHRYRDAIYYKKDQNATLKKEIIGGYILFPGNGEPLDVQKSSFYKSISEVNIGAFPLRPMDIKNRELLKNFIYTLINSDGQTLVEDSVPQKGLNYIIDSIGSEEDIVFWGYVRKPNFNDSQSYHDYYTSFENNSRPKFYYTGQLLKTTDVDLRLVKFLFTNIPGHGYYRIKRIYSALRKDLFADDIKGSMASSIRIVFELGEFIPLGNFKLSMSAIPNSAHLHIPYEGKFAPLKDLKRIYQNLTKGN
jgi:hypothetical protein